MDDGLSRRVAAPGNKDVPIPEPLSIAARGRVKDPRADKAVESRGREATVCGARCDDNHSGRDLSSVGQCEDPMRAPCAEAKHVARKDVFGSKKPGLLIRSLCQV